MKQFTGIVKVWVVCKLYLLLTYHYLCILFDEWYVSIFNSFYYPPNYEHHWDEYLTIKTEINQIFNQNP
jgi:hypothetical protein